VLIEDISSRIKQLREEREISMADLAKAINVSRSLISQVENGAAFPSLQTLERIANALGVSLSKFFQIEPHARSEDNVVVRSGERRIINLKDSRRKYHVLSPSPYYSDIEFLLCEFPRHQDGDKIDYFQHDGEEYFYVVCGEITLVVGEDTYELREDDSGCFKSNIRHYYINDHDETAKVLVAASERSVLE